MNNNNSPLLGRNFLRKFNFELVQINLITNSNDHAILIEQFKNEFHDVFKNDHGTYKLGKISLEVEKDCKPVFFKPRKVPFAWKAKIENTLRDLIAKNVIEQLNGDIRICGDYKVTINKYLSDFHYPLPLIDEIFASLQGGELFTKLDLSNAYNQLVLDEKSQMLCTWSTHIGTFKMKRLPFGVKPAAAIFQKTIEGLLRDIPFVVAYQDDNTVSGKNMSEHIKNLKLPIVPTDASNSAVAGILSHEFANNERKPIAFISGALSKAEQNYSTLEKETLAIFFCITKLKQYLIGNYFVIKMDHKPLTSIFSETKGLPIMAAARMLRWAFILSGFNYNITYVNGHSNDADQLSRMPQRKLNENTNEDSTFVNFIENDNILSLDFKGIAKETRRDPILSKICKAVKMGTLKNLKGNEFSIFVNKDVELTVEYDCLLWGYRVVIP
ncbi:uncharacterized protein K02A2.6-like [Teleopsis dalmanni]|uniref:uncharacterized protein K02A2.6-like n=1 Tax=Teleopsis dalmanni TaxID=139649 RepID=UPI0018CD945A|nr:uncharacterized protein K02A2.6-like [Teleopsis dalmanni]